MTTLLEIPKRGEREYFHAFGIVAVFVAASSTRVPCLIGYTRDLGRSLESIQQRWHWSIGLTHAWWLTDQASAQRIIDAINAVYPVDARGLFDIEADIVAAKIERAAAKAAVKITAHADAYRRVQNAVARVDSVIAAANAAGELRWFNRAYRSWRMAQPDDTAASLPYALARSRLRGAVVRRIARDEAPIAPADLLSEIFPQTVREQAGSVASFEAPPVGDSGATEKRTSEPGNANGRRRQRATAAPLNDHGPP